MRVLILGGYGHFGARIARTLASDENLHVIVGGRNGDQARATARMLKAEGLAVDAHDPKLGTALLKRSIDVVVHAAGPFQGQDYGVARACAAAGVHYIDLADGRRFVCDFPPALDEAFRDGHCVGVAGASTLPALSSAVVERLSEHWQDIDAIDTCIAPAQRVPRGRATLEAVLGYCGAPVPVWRDGQWANVRGWGDLQPVSFSRLPSRLGAPCDVPDLELFPQHYAVRERVLFRAALEVGITQRALAGLAWLRAHGVVPQASSWAGFLNRAAPWFDRFGSGRGGMAVRVQGRDARGTPALLGWHLTAPDGHGPEIPCIAAVELVRALANGNGPSLGAHACVGLVPLAAFEPHFRRWGMTVDVRDEWPQAAPRAAWLR